MKTFFAALLLVSVLVYSVSAKCKVHGGRQFPEGCRLSDQGTSLATHSKKKRNYSINKARTLDLQKRQTAAHAH